LSDAFPVKQLIHVLPESCYLSESPHGVITLKINININRRIQLAARGPHPAREMLMNGPSMVFIIG
jgi:hypothetical protein